MKQLRQSSAFWLLLVLSMCVWNGGCYKTNKPRDSKTDGGITSGDETIGNTETTDHTPNTSTTIYTTDTTTDSATDVYTTDTESDTVPQSDTTLNETIGSPPVEHDPFTAKQISAGSAYTCAVKLDETLICWGDNNYGLNYGKENPLPLRVHSSRLKHVPAATMDTPVACEPTERFFVGGTTQMGKPRHHPESFLSRSPSVFSTAAVCAPMERLCVGARTAATRARLQLELLLKSLQTESSAVVSKPMEQLSVGDTHKTVLILLEIHIFR